MFVEAVKRQWNQFLWRAKWPLRWRRKRKLVYSGIYTNFGEVPQRGYDTALASWIRTGRAEAATAVQQAANPPLTPQQTNTHRLFLSFLVLALRLKQESVRILDFGGWMGADFAFLQGTLSDMRSIHYTVVESVPIGGIGKELFPDTNEIEFLSELPAEGTPFDIVYCNSILPFRENYRETLRKLTEYGAEFILIRRVSAGNVPTFATAVLKVKGTSVPFWVFNLREIIDLVESRGYELVFQTGVILGGHMENLPADHRVGPPLVLLFAKKREGVKNVKA